MGQTGPRVEDGDWRPAETHQLRTPRSGKTVTAEALQVPPALWKVTVMVLMNVLTACRSTIWAALHFGLKTHWA